MLILINKSHKLERASKNTLIATPEHQNHHACVLTLAAKNAHLQRSVRKNLNSNYRASKALKWKIVCLATTMWSNNGHSSRYFHSLHLHKLCVCVCVCLEDYYFATSWQLKILMSPIRFKCSCVVIEQSKQLNDTCARWISLKWSEEEEEDCPPIHRHLPTHTHKQTVLSIIKSELVKICKNRWTIPDIEVSSQESI